LKFPESGRRNRSLRTTAFRTRQTIITVIFFFQVVLLLHIIIVPFLSNVFAFKLIMLIFCKDFLRALLHPECWAYFRKFGCTDKNARLFSAKWAALDNAYVNFTHFVEVTWSKELITTLRRWPLNKLNPTKVQYPNTLTLPLAAL